MEHILLGRQSFKTAVVYVPPGSKEFELLTDRMNFTLGFIQSDNSRLQSLFKTVAFYKQTMLERHHHIILFNSINLREVIFLISTACIERQERVALLRKNVVDWQEEKL